MTGDRENLGQIVDGLDGVSSSGDGDGNDSDSNKSGGARVTASEVRTHVHVVTATGDGWNGEQSSPGAHSSEGNRMSSHAERSDSETSSFWT